MLVQANNFLEELSFEDSCEQSVREVRKISGRPVEAHDISPSHFVGHREQSTGPNKRTQKLHSKGSTV
ncbi:MAG: hypothetical protein CMJ50_04220 [Planctomycetaceae bacterium]|nr:hypothetical protein [Planctomycetaceae bacterium]